MTRSHAKNSATQANLSHHERSLLRREGAARRLGNESFKPLDHCNLCLVKATDPVSCSQAHVYCRECALSDLISQRAGIEAQKRQLAQWEEDDAQRKEDARAAARDRVVAEFERGMGLGSSSGRKAADGKEGKGVGQQFTLDPEAIEKATREAEERASAAIAEEESESRKAKIAAFWLPDNTPGVALGPLKDIKLQTLCQVGKAHPFSMKGLLPVLFTYKGKGPGCPSCQKELNNATGAVLCTARERGEAGEPKKKKQKKKSDGVAICGHVVCVGCAESVVKPGMRCCVCEAQVDELIPLGKEGTGFAAAGGAEVKRDVVAFRV